MQQDSRGSRCDVKEGRTGKDLDQAGWVLLRLNFSVRGWITGPFISDNFLCISMGSDPYFLNKIFKRALWMNFSTVPVIDFSLISTANLSVNYQRI